MSGFTRDFIPSIFFVLGALAGSSAVAVDANQRTTEFNIAASELADALSQIGAQSGLQVVYAPDLAQGLKSKPLSGRLTPDAALKQLLARTGLTWSYVNSNVVVLKRAEIRTSAATPEKVAVAAPVTEESSPAVSAEVEEIVVNARKREERLQDVPASIAAATAGEWAASGAWMRI